MNKTKVLLAISLLGVTCGLSAQGMGGSSDLQVLNKRINAASLGYTRLTERVQSLESQVNHLNRNGRGAGPQTGNLVAELNAIKARLAYLEGGDVRIPERMPQVGGGDIRNLTQRLEAVERALARASGPGPVRASLPDGLDAAFVMETERGFARMKERIDQYIEAQESRHLGYVDALVTVQGESSDRKLIRRVALLESQVEELQKHKNKAQDLENRMKEIQDANNVLMQRVNQQSAQMEQFLVSINQRHRTAGPLRSQGNAVARVDPSAFLRTARAASSSDEIPQVNCSELSKNRDSDWSVAVLHALPTQRFMKLDRGEGIVMTTDLGGNPAVHRMAEVRRLAGCN